MQKTKSSLNLLIKKFVSSPIYTVLLIILIVIFLITIASAVKTNKNTPNTANLITSTETNPSLGEIPSSVTGTSDYSRTNVAEPNIYSTYTTTNIPSSTTQSSTSSSSPTSATSATTSGGTNPSPTEVSTPELERSMNSTFNIPETIEQPSAPNEPTSSPQIPRTTPQPTIPNISIPKINKSSTKIKDLGTVVEERRNSIDNSKKIIKEIINTNATGIIQNQNNDKKPEQKEDANKIQVIRNNLLKNVDSSLPSPITVTPSDINKLKTEVEKGIEDINIPAVENPAISKIKDTSLKEIVTTFNLLTEAVVNQTDSLRKQEADLLYKDSNEDGISDYDSIYVYNMDPEFPSPVTVYEGKTINAGEKILLGLDPAQSEVVKIEKEQAVNSGALTVSAYKLKQVALTEKKGIFFKGQALPNSFITLYIYSTPIIVTIKTDKQGEWEYVLDKELENGDHTVYVATVNNSGNIIAKSSPYLFTKTAEAATLQNDDSLEASFDNSEPGLLENLNIFIILAAILAVIIVILIIVGIGSKKNNESL